MVNCLVRSGVWFDPLKVVCINMLISTSTCISLAVAPSFKMAVEFESPRIYVYSLVQPLLDLNLQS